MDAIKAVYQGWQASYDTWMYYVIEGCFIKGGSYGGPPCSDYVDARIHVAEGVVWTAITFLLFWGLGMYGRLHRLAKQAMEHERAIHAKRSWFDVALATVHMAVFYQLVNYKMVSRTMLIQLQPCHIILALQAFILMSPPRKLPLVLSLLHLPWMAGCLAAMVVPDTQGLLQFFEVEIYWIEHILVAITTPLYLMLRHEAAVTRLFNSDALLCGVWTLLPFHWPLVASINFYTKVNLNFMLCPTEGMKGLFRAMSVEEFLYPSYRSVITVIWLVVAATVTLLYVGVGRALTYVLFTHRVGQPLRLTEEKSHAVANGKTRLGVAADLKANGHSNGHGRAKSQKKLD